MVDTQGTDDGPMPWLASADRPRSTEPADLAANWADGRICILTGHRCVPQVEFPHDLRRDGLQSLLDRLQGGVRFSNDLLAGSGHLPVVALTFDDGSEDHAWVARMLAERAVPAVFFVVTGLLGTPGFLSWEQARELVKLGHEMGSHGVDHLPVRNLSQAEVREQAYASKARLEDELQVPVRYFAPPFGYDAPGLAQALVAAGYQGSRLTRWGLYHPHRGNPWQLPSIPLTEFTVTAGWPDRVLRQGRVPLAMRATRAGRAVLPEPLRVAARRALNATVRSQSRAS